MSRFTLIVLVVLALVGTACKQGRKPPDDSEARTARQNEPRSSGSTRWPDTHVERVRFYTMNALYTGARMSLRDKNRRVVWEEFPATPADWDIWRLAERNAVVKLPAEFDVSSGVDLVVHFQNGTASRFRCERLKGWLGEPDTESIYLHVCGEPLRPSIYLNGAGGEYNSVR